MTFIITWCSRYYHLVFPVLSPGVPGIITWCSRYYHLVFPVKYRKALIRPEIEAEPEVKAEPEVEAELVRIAGEIAERYDIEFEQMGADRDHIHLLCSAHPKRGPGEIVRIYKSITKKKHHEKHHGARVVPQVPGPEERVVGR